RGRYVLRSASLATRAAATYGGVVSMRSAAERHGWEQRKVPDLPDITFPRNHRVERVARKVLVPHWSELGADDVVAGVTSKRRTLIDCMRNLPLEEAVSIVDSALRARDISFGALRVLAAAMRGRGRARAMAVAAMASPRAANPFESTLRAIASTIPGLHVEPQRPIRLAEDHVARPDLVDEAMKIVIEAESFEWHGESAAMTRDCVRYNAFTNQGWTVIRFSWWQVIFMPAYVAGVLASAVALVRGHANVARGSPERHA
ncbi:MAG: hypothetical protein JWR35_3649, partial [Marmoricola sp.]|nr:hypothetical protein [Marmoricola sp.]